MAVKYVPVSWKKAQAMLKKLGYTMSEPPEGEDAKEIYNIYTDKNGYLVVVSDD